MLDQDVLLDLLARKDNRAYQYLYQCYYVALKALANYYVKDNDVAAAGTIRAWFGLGKRSEPNREKMVQLAFALGLSHQELDEYLQKGLRMPGIQVNDYREMIYYYGLEHGLSLSLIHI